MPALLCSLGVVLGKYRRCRVVPWVFPLLILSVACEPAAQGDKGGFSMPVVAAAARQQEVQDRIDAVGTVAANEQVEIQSEVDGIVEAILFQEGEFVEKGKLLFKINEQKLALRVAQAEADFALAEANLKRSKSLLGNRTISSQEYDQAFSQFSATRAALELARQQLLDAHIEAPFSGVMGAKHISEGQLVNTGQTLSTIVDLHPMKAEFSIPERFAAALNLGSTVEVSVAAYPDKQFKGTVFFISPLVARDTRTLLLKAMVDNPDRELKAGMFATLSVITDSREHATTIPESAIVLSQSGPLVYIVEQGEKGPVAAIRSVKLGTRLPGLVEITSGISGDALVVVEGHQKIFPGASLQVRREDKPDSHSAANNDTL